jgi:hypothetical protein
MHSRTFKLWGFSMSIRKSIGRPSAAPVAAVFALSAIACTASAANAQPAAGGRFYVPSTSIERAQDHGKRAHTNVKLYFPAEKPVPGANTPGGYFETPASLACL